MTERSLPMRSFSSRQGEASNRKSIFQSILLVRSTSFQFGTSFPILILRF